MTKQTTATKQHRSPWLGIRRRICETCGVALSLRAYRTRCATCLKGRTRKAHAMQEATA